MDVFNDCLYVAICGLFALYYLDLSSADVQTISNNNNNNNWLQHPNNRGTKACATGPVIVD